MVLWLINNACHKWGRNGSRLPGQVRSVLGLIFFPCSQDLIFPVVCVGRVLMGIRLSCRGCVDHNNLLLKYVGQWVNFEARVKTVDLPFIWWVLWISSLVSIFELSVFLCIMGIVISICRLVLTARQYTTYKEHEAGCAFIRNMFVKVCCVLVSGSQTANNTQVLLIILSQSLVGETHIHALTHVLTYSHTLSHTHTCTHTLLHIHTYTYTHTQLKRSWDKIVTKGVHVCLPEEKPPKLKYQNRRGTF